MWERAQKCWVGSTGVGEGGLEEGFLKSWLRCITRCGARVGLLECTGVCRWGGGGEEGGGALGGDQGDGRW